MIPARGAILQCWLSNWWRGKKTVFENLAIFYSATYLSWNLLFTLRFWLSLEHFIEKSEAQNYKNLRLKS